MTSLFVFSALLLGIALVIWMALDLVWRAGLWVMNWKIRKRGEREALVSKEEVRHPG